MPIIYGIAALAVTASGFDQAGIDPLSDKQYAIVKQNDAPVASATTAPIATDPQVAPGQVPGWSTSFAPRNRCEETRTLGISMDLQSSITTAQDGNIVITTSQGPAIAPGLPGDVAVSAPVLETLGTQGAPAVVQTWSGSNLRGMKGMDRRVSAKFNNASASDVLGWLSKQNVNFIANTDNLPKSKVTMNLNNVPLHEALEAVAEALGGSWQVKGSTLIFHNGFMLGGAPFAARSFFTPQSGTSPFMKLKGFDNKTLNFKWDESQMKALKDFDGKAFKWDGKDMKPLDEKQMKELQGKFKAFDGKAFKMDEKQMKALQDQMKNFKWDESKVKSFKWDDGQFKAFSDKDGKLFKMDEKQMKELAEKMKNFKWDDKAFKNFDGKAFQWDGKDMKTLDDKQMKALTEKMKNFKWDDKAMTLKGFDKKAFNGDLFKKLDGKAFTFKKLDVKKLMDSFTPAQKDLMKKQGYLKFSDLTEVQRKMIFDGPSSEMPKDMTIVFSQDGEKVTIKN